MLCLLGKYFLIDFPFQMLMVLDVKWNRDTFIRKDEHNSYSHVFASSNFHYLFLFLSFLFFLCLLGLQT